MGMYKVIPTFANDAAVPLKTDLKPGDRMPEFLFRHIDNHGFKLDLSRVDAGSAICFKPAEIPRGSASRWHQIIK
jgi:hypothetical protein